MAPTNRSKSVETRKQGTGEDAHHVLDSMEYEWIRLGSFKSFPRQSEGRPIKLAKAGFIYTRTREGDDTVTCFTCGVTKNNWLKYENPLQIHKDLNARCNFVNNTSTNVGILVPGPDEYNKILEKLHDKYHISSPEGDSELTDLNSDALFHVQADAHRARHFYYDSPHCDLEIFINHFNLAISARFAQRMVVETARLRTFQHWPIYSAVRPIELARVGFYYLGSADLVRCAFCGGILRDWEQAESPVAEHWRYFSSCEFLRGTDQSNVPIIPNDTYIHDYVSTHPLSSTDEDVTAALDPLSTILNNGHLNLVQSDVPATAEDLGIITQTAAQPDKAILATRVATFANWPRRSPLPSKEQIAEAGFYFLDREDGVRCFFCGGVLKSWRDEDIPWNEHAKWFPKCAYLLRIKGQDFVNTIHQPGTGTAKVVETNGSTGVSGQLYKNSSDTDNAALDMHSLTVGSGNKSNGDVLKTKHQVVTDKNPHVPIGTLTAFEAGPAEQQASETATIPPPGEESSKVLRENEELKEQRLCKICMDAESNIVLLPCGHLVACEICAPVLTKCPMCRKAVRGNVKTYLS